MGAGCGGLVVVRIINLKEPMLLLLKLTEAFEVGIQVLRMDINLIELREASIWVSFFYIITIIC